MFLDLDKHNSTKKKKGTINMPNKNYYTAIKFWHMHYKIGLVNKE